MRHYVIVINAVDFAYVNDMLGNTVISCCRVAHEQKHLSLVNTVSSSYKLQHVRNDKKEENQKLIRISLHGTGVTDGACPGH